MSSVTHGDVLCSKTDADINVVEKKRMYRALFKYAIQKVIRHNTREFYNCKWHMLEQKIIN